MGNPQGALEDLDLATDLDRSFTQSWVKKASVHMELGEWLSKFPTGCINGPFTGQTDEAFDDFNTAIEMDPQDPDTYYHRGQVYFILGRYGDAITQYKKSTELDGDFIYSQIQHGVSLYKEGRKEKAELKFRKLMKNFAGAPEVRLGPSLS
jgi:import receptor subunit TOM70